MVRFIDLLGYREITLKSDTEPAIVAFRNRVAAMFKAEVATEDAVKGVKPSNGLVENAVMLLRGVIRNVKCHACGELHTRRTSRRFHNLAMVGGTCGQPFVQVPERSKWSDAF